MVVFPEIRTELWVSYTNENLYPFALPLPLPTSRKVPSFWIEPVTGMDSVVLPLASVAIALGAKLTPLVSFSRRKLEMVRVHAAPPMVVPAFVMDGRFMLPGSKAATDHVSNVRSVPDHWGLPARTIPTTKVLYARHACRLVTLSERSANTPTANWG